MCSISIKVFFRSSDELSTCILDFDNSVVLPKYPPTIVDMNGDWVLPQRSSVDSHSVVEVPRGDVLVFACSGTSFESTGLLTDSVVARYTSFICLLCMFMSGLNCSPFQMPEVWLYYPLSIAQYSALIDAQ
jgi:hypothetical protein